MSLNRLQEITTFNSQATAFGDSVDKFIDFRSNNILFDLNSVEKINIDQLERDFTESTSSFSIDQIQGEYYRDYLTRLTSLKTNISQYFLSINQVSNGLRRLRQANTDVRKVPENLVEDLDSFEHQWNLIDEKANTYNKLVLSKIKLIEKKINEIKTKITPDPVKEEIPTKKLTDTIIVHFWAPKKEKTKKLLGIHSGGHVAIETIPADARRDSYYVSLYTTSDVISPAPPILQALTTQLHVPSTGVLTGEFYDKNKDEDRQQHSIHQQVFIECDEGSSLNVEKICQWAENCFTNGIQYNFYVSDGDNCASLVLKGLEAGGASKTLNFRNNASSVANQVIATAGLVTPQEVFYYSRKLAIKLKNEQLLRSVSEDENKDTVNISERQRMRNSLYSPILKIQSFIDNDADQTNPIFADFKKTLIELCDQLMFEEEVHSLSSIKLFLKSKFEEFKDKVTSDKANNIEEMDEIEIFLYELEPLIYTFTTEDSIEKQIVLMEMIYKDESVLEIPNQEEDEIAHKIKNVSNILPNLNNKLINRVVIGQIGAINQIDDDIKIIDLYINEIHAEIRDKIKQPTSQDTTNLLVFFNKNKKMLEQLKDYIATHPNLPISTNISNTQTSTTTTNTNSASVSHSIPRDNTTTTATTATTTVTLPIVGAQPTGIPAIVPLKLGFFEKNPRAKDFLIGGGIFLLAAGAIAISFASLGVVPLVLGIGAAVGAAIGLGGAVATGIGLAAICIAGVVAFGAVTTGIGMVIRGIKHLFAPKPVAPVVPITKKDADNNKQFISTTAQNLDALGVQPGNPIPTVTESLEVIDESKDTTKSKNKKIDLRSNPDHFPPNRRRRISGGSSREDH